MATTSEIQVTEAYIGLLGRAPDPAGLAYWAKQLDDAIAAGEDAAVALKKLTNDITLNAEWKSAGGLGLQDVSTQAGADNLVNGMYQNLFGRNATAADKTYWSAELMAGTTTASEMAVQLIQGASTTDAATLGYKQEAATYYVETIAQSDYSSTTAKSSVSSVDSPLTVQASKAATDALATGVGNTINIGTDTITMTLGDDILTGTVKATGGYTSDTTSVVDASTTDQDVMTLSAIDDFNLGTTTNVETVNINLEKSLGDEFDINAAKMSGGDLNITTAATTTVGGVVVTGTTEIDVENVAADVNLVGVTTADIDMNDAAGNFSITADASLTTLVLDDANDAGISITLANDSASQSVTVTGDGANDVVTISANNAVALNLTGGGTGVDDLAMSGNTNDVIFTITNATPADANFSTSGSKNVTMRGAAGDFTGSTFTSTSTGSDTLDITTGGALDLTKWALVSELDLGADMDNDTVTINNGQAVTISAAQTGNDTEPLTFVEAGATQAAGDALVITAQNDSTGASSIALGQIETNGYESLTINANTQTVTGLVIDTQVAANNDASFYFVSTNDVTFAADTGVSVDTGAGTVSVIADTITLAGDVKGKSITLTATNEIVATAENIVSENGGSILITAGSTLAAATVVANDSGAGENVTISASDIDVTGVIKGYDISLEASNDSATATLGGDITAANNLSITGGKFDVNGNVTVGSTLTISGDANVDASGATDLDATAIVITSTRPVNLGDDVTATVINGASATNDITATLDEGTVAAMTVNTGSGNDTLVFNDDIVFTSSTGDGVDNVTLTDVKAGSSFNTGDGADVIALNDVTSAHTVNAGDGNDVITFAAAGASAPVVDAGAGTDTVKMSGDYKALAGNIVTNYEVMVLTGATTLSHAQFANDNTFELEAGGASVLTVTGAASATGVTIDASNLTFDIGAVATTSLVGSGAGDTITGSQSNDVIDAGAGNDTITLGAGTDHIDYTTGADGIDTVADFTGGTDEYDTNYAPTSGDFNLVNTAVNLAAAPTIANYTGVQQFTGATLSLADASNDTKVIAAISNGTVNITKKGGAVANTLTLISVQTADNTFLYEMNDADNDGVLDAGELTLVGVFSNGVTFVNGDIV